MMTARENLMAVFRHEKPAWVPCAPHIANLANIPGQLPHYLLQEPLDRLTISRYIGGDVLYEVKAVDSSHENVEVDKLTKGNELIETIKTPQGNLRTKVKTSKIPTPVYAEMPPELGYPPPLNVNTRTEWFVKGIDDYQKLRYYYNNRTYQVKNEIINDALTRVGDDGLVAVSGPSTPLYSLISKEAGIERTIYDLYDYPQELEKTMEIMAEKNYEWYREACETSVDIIRCTEDLDTNLISPQMFAKYCVPVIKKYAEICHEHGKPFMIHMCGHIKEFLGLLKETNVDAIHCLCPPSTGNTPLSLAKESLGDNITIMARIDPPVLLNEDPLRVCQEVKSMLQEVIPGDNFMLILPCGRAPLNNLQAVIETMNKYGKYPLRAW